jgi:hypothetical protein
MPLSGSSMPAPTFRPNFVSDSELTFGAENFTLYTPTPPIAYGRTLPSVAGLAASTAFPVSARMLVCPSPPRSSFTSNRLYIPSMRTPTGSVAGWKPTCAEML